MIARRSLTACKTLALAGLLGSASAALAADEAPAFADRCAAARALLPANVTLTTLETVAPAPHWQSPTSPTSPKGEAVRADFCRLAGRIDGDIGFELWLPRDWNRRFLGTGVGGEAGYYNYADMARGVEQGFAAASSDTGHRQGERWIDDARKSETYAHLAYHRLTQVSKAIIDGFYGAPAAHAYFLGCSGGGRQGLRELQLYPGDYDGALIGAPGLDVPLLAARLLHVHLAQTQGDGVAVSAADWDLVSRRAIARCDRDDGAVDGIIDDPRSCAFRVEELACKPGQSKDCLAPAAVKTIANIVAPLTDNSGKTHDFGLLPGITARPGGLPPLPVQMFGHARHSAGRGDAGWDPASFDLAADLAAARKSFATMDARSADMRTFAARGGKLILYHGWADASVQPLSTLDLFARMGAEAEQDRDAFARLYMVPGMQHCRGGAGTDRFGGSEDRSATGKPESDLLAALVAWVEQGTTPGAIFARHADANGTVTAVRPLCAWPAQASRPKASDAGPAADLRCDSHARGGT
ncbi:feruloyl esterase [Sphingobium sp. B7D2B]|uniref:tannase/feruloyl esterase family alpha/beta hydrolase n=1 Tax=Sphingobium sp. B7D2B TaxID=2940583 RepID=UPI0022243194|nr:tannase/feruloyl esterase family alpha/beta hydrolase [Sphingobium sp. B7D2B]MCW2367719.1 feruloyl esterase [Sphingobium sp. B7D2B]